MSMSGQPKTSTSLFTLSVSMSDQQNEYMIFCSVRVNIWATKRVHHFLLCPCQCLAKKRENHLLFCLCQCLANKTSTSPFALSVSMSGQQNEYITFCSVRVHHLLLCPCQCLANNNFMSTSSFALSVSHFCCDPVNVWPTKCREIYITFWLLLCLCQCLANKTSTSPFAVSVLMSGQQNEYIIFCSVRVSVWPTKRVHHLLLCLCQCLANKTSTSSFAVSVSVYGQHSAEKSTSVTFCSVRVSGQCDFHGAAGPVRS